MLAPIRYHIAGVDRTAAVSIKNHAEEIAQAVTRDSAMRENWSDIALATRFYNGMEALQSAVNIERKVEHVHQYGAMYTNHAEVREERTFRETENPLGNKIGRHKCGIFAKRILVSGNSSLLQASHCGN
jgi:hypothetical protein